MDGGGRGPSPAQAERVLPALRLPPASVTMATAPREGARRTWKPVPPPPSLPLEERPLLSQRLSPLHPSLFS